MSALTGRSPRDANRVPALFAVSTVDGVTVVPLEANPANGALQIEGSFSPPSSSLVFGTAVGVTDTTGIILAANPSRTGATIFNEGPDSCYVNFGPIAWNNVFVVKMVVNSYYEVPYGWVGDISAVCDTAENANLAVTELS